MDRTMVRAVAGRVAGHTAWHALASLPLAVRSTMGLARASVAVLRTLILVTALTPVFALLLTTLAVREAGERARRTRPFSSRECG